MTLLKRLRAWLYLRCAAPSHTTLRLAPGDTLVMLFKDHLRPEGIANVRENTGRLFPHNEVLIVCGDVTLVTLTK